MRTLVSLLLIAAGTAASACPKPAEVKQQDMFGTWRAMIEGRGISVVRLQRHPEFGGSFTGTAERAGKRARIAGDIDQGEFTLEESLDGTRVSASWVGRLVDGSCGREIRGTWQADGDDEPIVPFVMKKEH